MTSTDEKTNQRQLFINEAGELVDDRGELISDDDAEAKKELQTAADQVLTAWAKTQIRSKTPAEIIDLYAKIKATDELDAIARAIIDALPEATAKGIKAAAKDILTADPDDEKAKLILKGIAISERAAHQPHEKIKAADKKRAADAGAISHQPRDIITITDKKYKGGTSFYNNGGATLALLKNNIDIQITEHGRLYFPKIGEISEIDIENTLTHEQIESINLPLLRVFYTYIAEQTNEAIKRGDPHPFNGNLLIDAGTLAAELGESRPTSTRARDKAIAAAKSFHNIAGKMVNDQHATPSYYQVLNFEKYDSKTNTIQLSAPYLAYLFQEVYKNNLRRDNAGKLQYNSNGDLLTKAYHGHGIQNELIKKYGRNKAVLENLFILDAVIEPAGKHPNITAREIINRNLYLKDLLQDKDTHDANQTLKRIFKKTWQALQETQLVAMYESIKLPDPDDPQSIPTIDTLDYCYHFDNTGKKKGL